MDSAAPDDDCCVGPLCATARSGRLRERIGGILHLRSRSRGVQSCRSVGLQGIASEAQVALPRRPPRAPRVHDLRHGFICHRLEDWYAKGLQIDRHILSLCTYVGHTKVTDTYWYLTATPELLALAAQRFARSRHVLSRLPKRRNPFPRFYRRTKPSD